MRLSVPAVRLENESLSSGLQLLVSSWLFPVHHRATVSTACALLRSRRQRRFAERATHSPAQCSRFQTCPTSGMVPLEEKREKDLNPPLQSRSRGCCRPVPALRPLNKLPSHKFCFSQGGDPSPILDLFVTPSLRSLLAGPFSTSRSHLPQQQQPLRPSL